MSKSSKPRKAYKPKREHIPMMGNSRDNLAMSLHMDVEAAVLAPSFEAMNTLSRKAAILSAAVDYQSTTKIHYRDDPQSKALVAMLLTLESIDNRYQKVGKWGVTGDEAKTLRVTAGVLDESLSGIPMNVFQAAKRLVDDLMRGAQ